MTVSHSASLLPPAGTRSASVGWLCRWLLLLGAVIQLSRILQVQSSTGEVPFFSANDRSRWCTIAALAVSGTYEIDSLIELRDPKTKRRTWYTIDLVRHRGADGKQHYYSSKPPLLPTLYTGIYLAIRAVTGQTLMGNPFFVAKVMLVLVNLLPLVAWWWLMIRWFEREQLNNWALVVATLFTVAGTFLTTFVTTLNNHLPAALAVGLSLWCIDRIALQRDHRWRWFVLCGIATSFGGANELPALSWIAAAAAILLLIDVRKTVLAYVPALLPIAVAFFVANFAAHGEWIPAYAHRGVGEKLFEFTAPADTAIDALSVEMVAHQLQTHGIDCSNNGRISAARRPGVFEFWDADNEFRFALQALTTNPPAAANSDQQIGVYQWGDWYDYPGSYWTSERKQGVDKGEPNRSVYIFHSLIGHHGIFSLTPFWFVAIGGCVVVWRQRSSLLLWRDLRLLIVAAVVATSIVAIGFYLARPLEDRNYGGVASGFRWSFWLTPLWIVLTIYGLRTVSHAWLRRLVELALIVSIFSASYAWHNPWVSPWLMELLD
jgi:hypothetical protein